MMKKLLALLVFIPTASFAQPTSFKYQTSCYLEYEGQYLEDVCTVVETRNKQGFLNTRNVYSNKWSLTFKSRWNGEKFMSWDSYNKFEYHYPYQVVPGKGSKIMPGLILEEVSWD